MEEGACLCSFNIKFIPRRRVSFPWKRNHILLQRPVEEHDVNKNNPPLGDSRAMAWGASLIVNQAIEWNITPAKSATSLNYGILLQGFGGIIAVPLIEAYGR